jgi:hypothetical protein
VAANPELEPIVLVVAVPLALALRSTIGGREPRFWVTHPRVCRK